MQVLKLCILPPSPLAHYMNELTKFTRFVKETRIAETIRKQQELLKQSVSSTLQNEEQFYGTDYLLPELLYFLTAVEQSVDTTDPAYESLLSTGTASNANPDILTTILDSQKHALYAALPFYTTEVTTVINVVTELDKISFGLTSKIHHQWQMPEPLSGILKESEERYKDLFDGANDMIHIVEPDGTLMYVNNAWMKCLGYELNEIRGKSI